MAHARDRVCVVNTMREYGFAHAHNIALVYNVNNTTWVNSGHGAQQLG